MRRVGRAPVAILPVQARRESGDVLGVGRYTCSACRIDYQQSDNMKPQCPLCDAKNEMDSLRAQILAMGQEIGMLQQDLQRARAESRVVDAMRQAFSIAEPSDRANIKSIVYQWRENQSGVSVGCVRLSKPGKPRWALEVRFRDGRDGEFFVPESIGGVVFVESYRDLVNAQGTVAAMKQMAQSIAGTLAGS